MRLRLHLLAPLYALLVCPVVSRAQQAAAPQAPQASPAQQTPQTVISEVPSPWLKRVLPDALGELPGGLPYRLFLPKNYDPAKRYPLIVFLHGSGERGTDNQAQINVNGPPRLVSDEVQNANPCFVLAPQCPPGNTWQSWERKEPREATGKSQATVKRETTIRMAPQPSKPMRLLMQLLDELPREFSVDNRRIYLTGLSLGGFGTWELLARRPQMFAAAVPICGRADLTTAPLIKHIPIWAFHGDVDQSVSVEYSRSMVGAMRIFDAAIIYTEYPSVGHNSWEKAYVEPNLFAWLFAQRRQR